GPGNHPAVVKAATDFGKALATAGIRLVYRGGTSVRSNAGARAPLVQGVHATGIIPDIMLQREAALTQAQEMIVTKDMHERKRLMFEQSDAFVALPGGIGTLEELVEQLTWAQLGRHAKPILIADIDGFWQPLLALL